MLLAFLGGAAGLLFAYWAVPALVALSLGVALFAGPLYALSERAVDLLAGGDGGGIVGDSDGFRDFIPANGSAAAEITSWEAIPNVASTEVYLDPDEIGVDTEHGTAHDLSKHVVP